MEQVVDFSYFKQAWRGREKLRTVFWIYYIIGSVGISLLAILFEMIGIGLQIKYLGTTFALVLVLPYVVWVLGSIWSCAFNVDWIGWGYLARGFVMYTAGVYIYRIIA